MKKWLVSEKLYMLMNCVCYGRQVGGDFFSPKRTNENDESG